MASATADDGNDTAAIKPPQDVIIPPKDIRRIIEKSADLIVRRGDAFEAQIASKTDSDARLQFMQPENHYHSYYTWRKKEIAEGRPYPDEDGKISAIAVKNVRKGPPPPPEFEFSARMPTISAVDLEVVKLTALFVALKGTAWMTKFSQTYGQQSQFSFLRPQHSFHQFFIRLVDQYKELNLADGGDLAGRQARRRAELERNVADKYQLVEKAKSRAAYVKHTEAQKIKEEEKAEAEKVAYASIDWHKFAVVATIEFTAADEEVDLPAPTALVDIQSASLEQKSHFTAPVSRRLDEAMPSDDIFHQTSTPQPVASSVSPIPPPGQQYQNRPPPQTQAQAQAPTMLPPPPPPAAYIPAQAASDVENSRIAERQAEADRAAAARAAAAGTGPMRIRDDYVPRAQLRRQQSAATSICPICSQAIPNDEYEKHVRIEQLDPRWREQTRIAQQRSATTNLSTADVANNLKRLASQRSDVFDPVTGRQIEERDPKRVDTGEQQHQQQQQQQQQQLQQPNQPQQGVPPGMVGALPADRRTADVQEQIRAIQNRFGQQQQQQQQQQG